MVATLEGKSYGTYKTQVRRVEVWGPMLLPQTPCPPWDIKDHPLPPQYILILVAEGRAQTTVIFKSSQIYAKIEYSNFK